MSAGADVWIAALAAAYPRQRLEPATIQIYAAALDDLDARAIEDAVRYIVRTSRWFPTVAEIRETVAERTLRLPSPAAAWETVQTAQGRAGIQGGPVERALRAVGGTWALRTTENPTALRAQFLRVYGEFRDEAVREIVAPPGRALPAGGGRDLTPAVGE